MKACFALLANGKGRDIFELFCSLVIERQFTACFRALLSPFKVVLLDQVMQAGVCKA